MDKCENCHDFEAELFEVRRIYVIPPDWDREGNIPVEDTEFWCASCCTIYPHEPIAPDQSEPINE